MDNKSTLTRSKTMERLSDIAGMSDEEIKLNHDYIRLAASSAHNYNLRLKRELDKAKRQYAVEKERAFRLEQRNKALLAAVAAGVNGTFKCLASPEKEELY